AGAHRAVELDHDHGVVAVGERVLARSRLLVAVDEHRVDDLREGGARLDRVHTPAGDAELDRVQAGARVRLLDGGPQRAAAAGGDARVVGGVRIRRVARAVYGEGERPCRPGEEHEHHGRGYQA